MEDILIEKIALGKRITDEEIASALYEICVKVHPQCNLKCPVFRSNGNMVVRGNDRYQEYGCECYRYGSKMLTFLRSKRASDFTF